LSDVPGYEERKPAARKRVNPIKRKQLEARCQQVEQAIAQLESGIAECERQLQSFVSAEDTAHWSDLLAERRNGLGPLMAEWEELSQVLEQANA
jgi:exonuclease VII small subunit